MTLTIINHFCLYKRLLYVIKSKSLIPSEVSFPPSPPPPPCGLQGALLLLLNSVSKAKATCWLPKAPLRLRTERLFLKEVTIERQVNLDSTAPCPLKGGPKPPILKSPRSWRHPWLQPDLLSQSWHFNKVPPGSLSAH